MLSKVIQLFKSDKETPEQAFLKEHGIQYDPEQGYIIHGVVVNTLSERLEYFSNRRMKTFDNLKDLYFAAILINEKIDLEISTGRFVTRLGNTEENLLEFKNIVKVLCDYYRQFIRDKK